MRLTQGLLLGVIFPTATTAADCLANGIDDCLMKPGCAWFTYNPTGECNICKAVYGNQIDVVGCRDWLPKDYCQSKIFSPLQHEFGGDPKDNSFRNAVHHYQITQGDGIAGSQLRKRSACNVWCDPNPPHACYGTPMVFNDCSASNQQDCLTRQGCSWFSYNKGGGCPLCDLWFGKQAGVTGCRDWSGKDYCSTTIFTSALETYRKSPANMDFKEAVRHYRVVGNPGQIEAQCSVYCNPDNPDACWGAVKQAVTCNASTMDKCLGKPGCRWFSYKDQDACPLCKKWFGDQAEVTGCHDWNPQEYCEAIIFVAAEGKYDGKTSDHAFKQAVAHYHVSQGRGDPGDTRVKEARCSVWCDLAPSGSCSAQPRTLGEVKGVNYGGRFIPEHYLQLEGYEQLFSGTCHPSDVNGGQVRGLSLCDVGNVSNATDRVANFLDTSIQQKHFDEMSKAGFEIVRLPLGYWNVLDVPAEATPPGAGVDRWQRLQRILPAKAYSRWIDRVFLHAKRTGMKVLLDLHGAPGGQAYNAFTGCDQGVGHFDFVQPKSVELAVAAVEAMARICARHKDACYGIELLNEPVGTGGPLDPNGELIPRENLQKYYQAAILAARKHIDLKVPLVIMEWPRWLSWWSQKTPFSYKEHGNIIFAAHLYYMGPDLVDQQESRWAFEADLSSVAEFHLHSRYEIFVSEFGLNSHGSGVPEDDYFDYNSFANWFVHQSNRFALGSMVWNYDGPGAWGPVANKGTLGAVPIEWNQIFSSTGPAVGEVTPLALAATRRLGNIGAPKNLQKEEAPYPPSQRLGPEVATGENIAASKVLRFSAMMIPFLLLMAATLFAPWMWQRPASQHRESFARGGFRLIRASEDRAFQMTTGITGGRAFVAVLPVVTAVILLATYGHSGSSGTGTAAMAASAKGEVSLSTDPDMGKDATWGHGLCHELTEEDYEPPRGGVVLHPCGGIPQDHVTAVTTDDSTDDAEAPFTGVRFATVETRTYTQSFLLGKNGPCIKNLGVNKAWRGYFTKMILFQAFVRKQMHEHGPDQLLALIDGADMIFGGCEPQDLVQRYWQVRNLSKGVSVVAGAENCNWPPTIGDTGRYWNIRNRRLHMLKEQNLGQDPYANWYRGPKHAYCNGYFHANSGFLMGPAVDLLEVLRCMAGFGRGKTDLDDTLYDDQRGLVECLFRHPDKITLDYAGSIVLDMFGFNSDILWQNGTRLINKVTNTTQCFIHTNRLCTGGKLDPSSLGTGQLQCSPPELQVLKDPPR
jgi:hypothetical protein